MDYEVFVTAEAEEDLDRFLHYLITEKGSKQAARSVLNDFEATIKTLEYAAGSLKFCDNSHLKSLGYRRINFRNHRYFILYRIQGNQVFVDSLFHELQDCENVMI